MKIRMGFVSNSSSSSFVITKQVIKSMCNQNIPSVNLQTAVLMQVQEFVNSGQVFSRYDITKALRQKCNDGLLEIPEVENVDGNPRFDIRKNAVDAIFDQLYQNCLANGLPPLTYTYNQVLGYRVFSADLTAVQPTPVPTATPASFPSAAPLPATLSNSSVAPTQVVSVPVTTATNMPDAAELNRRIGLYMNNCQRIGKVPTLRQIQSAIKRGGKSTGLSRRECRNIAVSLGYAV